MLDKYRPQDFDAVAEFARRQPEFDYLKAVIEAHAQDRVRGACRVWREQGRIVAFCVVAFPNRRNARLYGMRVDDRYKGRGIATKLTRELFVLARKQGRTWIALDAKDVASKAPVFLIGERLGMKHVTTDATTMLWGVEPQFARPRLVPASGPRPDSPHALVVMRQTFLLWIWQRSPASSRLFAIAGARVSIEYAFGRGRRWAVVNAFERPWDTRAFAASLLGLASGPRLGVVLVSPARWQRALRRTACALGPILARGVNSSFDAWRIHGSRLSVPGPTF
jgi:GNAT superfamily N-acetyltransferase